jgi:hypothetical protein
MASERKLIFGSARPLATRSTMYIVHKSTYICVSLVRSLEMCNVCVLANIGRKRDGETKKDRPEPCRPELGWGTQLSNAAPPPTPYPSCLVGGGAGTYTVSPSLTFPFSPSSSCVSTHRPNSWIAQKKQLGKVDPARPPPAAWIRQGQARRGSTVRPV